jgi:hypothetical protein
LTDSPAPRPPTRHALLRHRELFAAIASGFVGALALATSTYNVYLQRQQVRAQVWPRLTFVTSLSKSDGLTVTLTNRGVGPAEVQRVRVLVDGKPAEDWPDALGKLLGSGSFSVGGIAPIEHEIVSPGLEIHALKIADTRDATKLVSQMDRLEIELCYCSTLDDCWIEGPPGPHLTPTTRPIDRCVPDAKPFKSLSDKTLNGMLGDLQDANDAGVRVILLTDGG